MDRANWIKEGSMLRRPTIESTTITVDDKHIEIAATASPSDSNANTGGIILKGVSDYKIEWLKNTLAFECERKVKELLNE